MISEISKNPIKYRNEPEWYKDWIALRNEVLNMETVEYAIVATKYVEFFILIGKLCHKEFLLLVRAMDGVKFVSENEDFSIVNNDKINIKAFNDSIKKVYNKDITNTDEEHGYKDLYSAEVYNKSGKGA